MTRALENLKNLHFNGLLLTKLYVWAEKKYRRVMFDGIDFDAKFEGKLTCAFKNDMRDLAKFHHVWKSKTWDIDGVLLPKVENVEA